MVGVNISHSYFHPGGAHITRVKIKFHTGIKHVSRNVLYGLFYFYGEYIYHSELVLYSHCCL